MTGIVSRLAIGLIAAGFAAGSASAQGTGGLPDYLAGITGRTPQTPAALATRDVLQLNASMLPLYDAAACTFQTNIMAKRPTILALCSDAGARMLPYRRCRPSRRSRGRTSS